MTRKEQLSVIHQAYNSIPQLFDGFKEVREHLFDMNRVAERQHQKETPAGCSNGLSIADAARLFTVKYLLEGHAEPEKWTVDALLAIRLECLYAQAYAKKFHTELSVWAQTWSEKFEQVDYSALMKVGR